jgi:diaminopimelate epimerase
MSDYVIMSGAGNRFFVVDDRAGGVKDPVAMTRQVCAEKSLDGGLFVRPSSSADFRMVIVNADGSEAEMCGNGSRCIARFAFDRGVVRSRTMSVETLAGRLAAEVFADGSVKVRLTDPKDIRKEFDLRAGTYAGKASFVNTGVPHTVILCDDTAAVDVVGLGGAIRRSEAFQPAGTNVNFMSVVDRRTIRVRTYERGVENETQACGTGSTASALVSFMLGRTEPPVTVLTAGGEKLVIHFEAKAGGVPSFTNVCLEGQVRYE